MLWDCFPILSAFNVGNQYKIIPVSTPGVSWGLPSSLSPESVTLVSSPGSRVTSELGVPVRRTPGEGRRNPTDRGADCRTTTHPTDPKRPPSLSFSEIKGQRLTGDVFQIHTKNNFLEKYLPWDP